MTVIFSIGNEGFDVFTKNYQALKFCKKFCLRLGFFFHPLKALVEFMVQTCMNKSAAFVG